MVVALIKSAPEFIFKTDYLLTTDKPCAFGKSFGARSNLAVIPVGAAVVDGRLAGDEVRVVRYIARKCHRSPHSA